MKITLDIQDSKAAAFLHFIQSLDFITINKQEGELKLTVAQKKAIDQGLKDIEEGKVKNHEQAMEELKKRHSKYFK